VYAPLLAQNTTQDSLKIFKSPNVTMDSGDMSHSRLLAGLKTVESKIWIKGSWSEKTTGWIRQSLVVDEWTLAQRVITREPAAFRTLPLWNSPPLGEIPTSETLQVLNIEENWTLVNFKGADVWVDRNQLQIDPQHWGFMILRSQSKTYLEPNFQSPSESKIRAGIRIAPLGIEGDFVKINWENKIQYLPLFAMVSRVNFASEVKIDNRWEKLKFLVGSHLKLENDQLVPLAKVQGLRGQDNLAYVIASRANLRRDPDLASPVVKELHPFYSIQVKDRKLVKWAKSEVPKIGPVYWKVSNPAQDSTEAPIKQSLALVPTAKTKYSVEPQKISLNDGQITTDELFSRKIFDMATSPKVPNLMFASASGLFKSLDGQVWTKLEEFESQNFPITFSEDGVVYVGPYRSLDHGKTFSQFVRWDKVLNSLSKGGVTHANGIRMSDIEILDQKGSKIKMTLKLGSKDEGSSYVMMSEDQGFSWSFAGQRTP
ncbi:MAG: hypothetical protein KDD25_05485, partial [Bdellovibrionales bacterium]|nr:hypothetical protein [Bdellovibrionales bacterium]